MLKTINSIKYLVPIFLCVEILGFLLIYGDYNRRVSALKTTRIQNLSNQYNATLNSYSLLTNTIFEEVIDQPEILSIIKRVYSSEDLQAKAVARGQLFAKLSDTYQRLVGKNFRQLHFHLPNGESLIRFHMLSRFGDNLFETRPSIHYVNTARFKVEGFEEGPGHTGFRYIFPLNYQGVHVGSAELGVSFQALRNSMEKLYSPETFAFMVRKDIIHKTVFADQTQKYRPSELSKDYLYEVVDNDSLLGANTSKIDSSILVQINSEVRTEAAQIIGKGQSLCTGVTVEGQDYVVTFLPIFNIEGRQTAYIFSAVLDPALTVRWTDLLTKMGGFTAIVFAFFAFMYVRERSRRKLAAQNRQIEEQAHRLQNITANMGEGLYVVDRSGMITYVNPAAEHLIGSSTSAMLGKMIDSFVEFQLGKNGETAVSPDPALKAMESGHKFSGESNMKIHKTGSLLQVSFTSVPIIEYGSVTGAVTVVEDVTERKQIEIELRRSEIRLRSVVNNALDAIISVDALGRIETFNPAAEAIFGFSMDEIIGQNANVLMPEPFASGFDYFVKKVLGRDSDKLFSRKQEIIAKRKDGTTFPVELSISEIRLGTQKMLLSIIHDISERKRFEQELIDARERAEKASRAKSEFLANMSHEIRTPMNGIIGMTQLALETELNPEQLDYLRTVKSSSDLLLKLINDILDFSKIEAGKLEIDRVDFKLRDTMADTIRGLAFQAEKKGLELLFVVSEDVPDALNGDPIRLRQIIVNLVANAIKFTETGEVVVTASLGDAVDAGVMIHFCISDTGIGIPPEKVDKIFLPFDQADTSTTRRFGGTGLGLSISTRLVQMMNGKIWVESEVGKGSKFHFTIKLETAREAILQKNPAPLRSLHGVRILIVDDNSTNLTILDNQLSNWGMLVTVAKTGAEALQVLKKFVLNEVPITIAILDCMMPEMDGFQLASVIKNSPDLQNTKLIMLTSATQVGDMEERKRFGLEAWLVKPVKQSELLDSILMILDEIEPSKNTGGTRQKPTQKEPHYKKANILLAEDNIINRTLAIRLLEKAGHKVTCAENGDQVLKLLANTKFDLILMDVSMPELDGYGATRRIREIEAESGSHIPIVAMTAHALKEDREKCLVAGMDDYITKPVNVKELFEKINSCVMDENSNGEESGECIDSSFGK